VSGAREAQSAAKIRDPSIYDRHRHTRIFAAYRWEVIASGTQFPAFSVSRDSPKKRRHHMKDENAQKQAARLMAEGLVENATVPKRAR